MILIFTVILLFVYHQIWLDVLLILGFIPLTIYCLKLFKKEGELKPFQDFVFEMWAIFMAPC